MANFFDQFDAQPGEQPRENFFDQFEAPQSKQGAESWQVSIPLPGGGSFKPSLIGMAKGLFEAGKSGTTLPRDVYQGKVDPLSDEGIGRATELATMTALPSAGRSLATRPTAPAFTELQTAARPTYKELTAAGNTVPVAGKDISTGIADALHPEGMRMANAPRTYREINRLSGASDLNDVAIARDKMRDIANGISENRLIKVAGTDSKASRSAMGLLDTKLDELYPGWTKQMAEADANWAAAARMKTVQKEADKGQKGRLGSFDTNETRAKGYTKEELSTIKKAHEGGAVGTILGGLSALNPLQGGLTGKLSALAHLASAIPTGGANLLGIPVGMAAGAAQDMLKRQALSQALQTLASRSPLGRSQTGTGMLQLPQTRIPPTLGLLPLEGRQRP